jgi:serine/threonine protein kinase
MGPDRKITAKTDIWSVGAITYWLLMKQEPTMPLGSNSVAEDCKRLDASDFSDDCKDFVKSAYVFDANQRADITRLMQHPWITSFKQELKSRK